jgi:FKBP-type peptidyl-prolyl cis-trans isomerases 1
MKNSILLAALISLGLVACTSNETPSGVKFTVLRKGDGVKVDSGKFMVMNMIFKDGKDSIWSDTRKNGFPAIVQMQDSIPKGDGVLEVIQMLTKGDSVSFLIPAKDLFTKTFRQPVPPMVDSTSSFTFVIGLSDVLNEEQVRQLQSSLVAKQNEKLMMEQKVQLGKDTVIIDNYLTEKGIKTQKTASGLRYVITKPGKGENAQSGQSVSINYAGYLLNGKYFDTSIEAVAKANNLFTPGRPYQPLEVVVGYQQVIQGWEEAMMLMNKGSKMTVYIPSTLAMVRKKEVKKF